jgi:hypothetical protein
MAICVENELSGTTSLSLKVSPWSKNGVKKIQNEKNQLRLRYIISNSFVQMKKKKYKGGYCQVKFTWPKKPFFSLKKKLVQYY